MLPTPATPTPLVGMRAVHTGTKQASHGHLTSLLRSSNEAVIGQHKFINKEKDFKDSTLYPNDQILIESYYQKKHLTTDQEVGGSTPSPRATGSARPIGWASLPLGLSQMRP
jgi:hypothetical protein